MKTLSLIVITLSLAMTSALHADPRNSMAAEKPRSQQRPQISASEAAARVRANEGGRILAVETVRGGAAYRIKVLNRRGQVRVITVDANPRR